MAPFSYGVIRVGITWLLFVLNFSGTVESLTTVPECPMGCFCDTKAIDTIPGGYGLKIQCYPTTTATGTFDIRLPSNTLALDLTKYGLTEIQADNFAGLVHLQKLDLQGNRIQSIENGSFRTLPKLEVLDLSRNSLKKIRRETLAGLASLQRLKLSDNSIRTIEEGSFYDLQSLKKVTTFKNRETQLFLVIGAAVQHEKLELL